MCKIQCPSHHHSTCKCAVDGEMHGEDDTDMPVRLTVEDLLLVIDSSYRLYGVTVDIGRLATEILAQLKKVVCINLHLTCGDPFPSSTLCCCYTKGATIS